jgi:1-phosphatidylinositol-4-phosphate 5-kinase
LRRLVVKGVLESYCTHLKNNPHSMLARFYGVYKIKIRSQAPTSIIVMDNIMGVNPDEVIKAYDLKGSTLGRIQMNAVSPLQMLKDLNFLENKEDRLRLS